MSAGRVFVIDDDAAVCDSLVLLMQSVGLQAEAFQDARSFLAAGRDDHPACIVLDVRMPGMSGPQVAKELAARGQTWPIIFITGHGDVAMAVEAMREGAFDFVQKPFREDELIQRVQQAIAQDHADMVIASEQDEIRECLAELTPREREILDRVVEGQANKVIAIELRISSRTVELHRARVMEKMRARSLAHLIRQVLLVVPESERNTTR